jgi:hypothetical protein
VNEGEPPKRTSRAPTTPPDEPPVETAPPEHPPPPRPLPLGRIALGLILLAVGVGWLLQALDVIDIPWDALLPVALIAVGVVLVIGSRTGRYGGLIALGIVLTITTALVAAVDLPLVGGVGQREITPLTAADLEPRYDLAIGQMVIDLTQLQLQLGDRVDLEARVGMGELVVRLPGNVTVTAHARAGLGDIQILGEEASGFAPERDVAVASESSRGEFVLDLSVGLGSVKVNAG